MEASRSGSMHIAVEPLGRYPILTPDVCVPKVLCMHIISLRIQSAASTGSHVCKRTFFHLSMINVTPSLTLLLSSQSAAAASSSQRGIPAERKHAAPLSRPCNTCIGQFVVEPVCM